MKSPRSPEDLVVTTRGLEKRYGAHPVLRGLDLSVGPGEVYGFLGKNGAGKTTTLRALMGIHRVDGGRLWLFGEECKRPRARHKRRIGYVSQESFYYDWMTCEALARFIGRFYATWDHAELRRLFERLDIPPKRRVSELSGGTRVKLALALALAHRPTLLLLDEPTSGLDPAARREFVDLVREQAARDGRATLFSSHIVAEVQEVASTVGILHEGRMAYEGPPSRLLAELRRVVVPDGQPAPPLPESTVVHARHRRPDGVEIVARAPVTAWQELAFEGTLAEPVTLEEAFLAIVARGARP